MNNKLKRTWKKTVVAKEGITRNLKGLRETTKTLTEGRGDLNPKPSE
jgi:hypothetical protein